MNASKWMKWLSVIALIFAVSDVVYKVSFTYGDNFSLTSLSIVALLLSVVAIIASFNKDSPALTSRKK